MVLLAMTPRIVLAVAKAKELSPSQFIELQQSEEPALTSPKPGDPISHRQLIDVCKFLQKHDDNTLTTLAALLQSATLYVPPPPSRPAQTPEYTAFMAGLRAEEEYREYKRMIDPPFPRETFTQRFPRAPDPFSIGSTPHPRASDEEEVSFEEVHRQMILIINVLLSIVCVAVFIWVVARHWTIGKRLGLSMAGSGAVAIAEVAVYGSYIRKVKEAKRQEKKKEEVKEIVQSWIVEKSNADNVTDRRQQKGEDGVRFRKGKHR